MNPFLDYLAVALLSLVAMVVSIAAFWLVILSAVQIYEAAGIFGVIISGAVCVVASATWAVKRLSP